MVNLQNGGTKRNGVRLVEFHHLVEKRWLRSGSAVRIGRVNRFGQGAVDDLPPGGGLEQTKAFEGGDTGAGALSQANGRQTCTERLRRSSA